MKKCTKCNDLKEISEFSWKDKDRRRSQCKSCRNKYHKDRWKNNPNVRRRNKKAKRRIREKGRSFINRYKRFCKCSNCGEERFYVLQFHHIDDNKEHSIANMAGQGYSIESIKDEIRKCKILCSNCHLEEHYLNNF